MLIFILFFVLLMVFFTSGQQTQQADNSQPLFYQSHYWYSPQQQQQILQLNLFGVSAPIESTETDSFRIIHGQPLSQYIIDHAPPTESDEQLTGIVFGGQQGGSIITLRNSLGQQTYTDGQTILGSNEKILLITPDKVIVDLNGYYRSIVMQD